MEKAREFHKSIYFCFIDYAKAFDCVDHNKLWKILKDMGIPDHLTCLLRNLYTGQEATVRTGHEKTDWFQIGKGVCQGCILSPCVFNLYAECYAKSLQSCPTLCNPIDSSPPGPPIPGILQARTPEWVAISLSNAWKWKVKVKSLSRVRLSATPWTAAHQAPPSMGLSRQEYWSGVPLPSLEYIMRNAGLEEAQAGIKIAGRNINNLRYVDDTTFMAESKEELKSLWWKWKRRVKKLA